eukprot:gene7948-1164_t
MGSLWQSIVAQTSQSPGRLFLFGSLMTAGTYVVGSIFSGMTVPAQSEAARKKQLDGMSHDDRRMAIGQQQRLSTMIKDAVNSADNGAADKQWQAAMRGTLVPHPDQQVQSKTYWLDKQTESGKADYQGQGPGVHHTHTSADESDGQINVSLIPPDIRIRIRHKSRHKRNDETVQTCFRPVSYLIDPI